MLPRMATYQRVIGSTHGTQWIEKLKDKITSEIGIKQEMVVFGGDGK